MKKTKRWKLEGCYYGSGTKFDRNFIKNYEGTHLPIHRFRDRRNWKGSHAWIPHKYLEGLIQKYINQPIEALEEAYNNKAKDVKNHYPFKKAYSCLIYQFRIYSHYKYCNYEIVNGILKKILDLEDINSRD